MTRPASLSSQLFRSVALGQMLAFAFATAAFLVVTSDASPNAMAHDRASILLKEAVKAGDGERIEMTESLAGYLVRRPNFLYGVSVGDRWLPGSTISTEVPAPTLGNAGLRDVRFVLASDKHPNSEGQATTSGDETRTIVIFTAGNQPDALDVIVYLFEIIKRAMIFLASLLAAVLLATRFALARGIAPLRRLAETAASVDLRTAQAGIDDRAAPLEVRPLLGAYNASLARIADQAGERQRFLDTAAHEIRTPLTIIRARIEHVAQPDVRVLLQRDARRLSAIVDQLLASARMTAQLDRPRKAVDAVALARELVGDYAPLAHSLGRSVSLIADAAPVWVLAHAPALSAAVANLIDNALRVEPEGGCIDVIVERPGAIKVRDHGPGLDNADMEHVFKPFWRREDSTGGAGLGLSIVAEIMALHEGRVTIEETPGGGATFTLVFNPSPDLAAPQENVT